MEGGQRRAFTELGLGRELATHQATPAADLSGSGVLNVREHVRPVLDHRQVDVDRAALHAGRRAHRRAHPQARHVGGQQQVALGSGHVEGLHAPQFLGVALHSRLGRPHIAPDADVDHMRLDHLKHQGAVSDSLLRNLDARQDAVVEHDLGGAIADGADRRDRLGFAKVVGIGAAQLGVPDRRGAPKGHRRQGHLNSGILEWAGTRRFRRKNAAAATRRRASHPRLGVEFRSACSRGGAARRRLLGPRRQRRRQDGGRHGDHADPRPNAPASRCGAPPRHTPTPESSNRHPSFGAC